jgi:hypothetical protein
MCAEAGAITLGLREGERSVRSREIWSRETLGAGAMILASRAGATSEWSELTAGAGGTTAAFSAGADRDLTEETLGAGAITAS